MHILIENLPDAKKDIGSITRIYLLILLVLTICTCSGPRLMLGSQTSEKLIDCSSFFGKHAKRTNVVTECVILKTVDPDLVSCLQVKPSIRLQLLQTHASGYCPNLDLMLRRCLPIKSYRYQSIYRSSLSQYKMEWIDRNRSSRTGYQPRSLPRSPLPQPVKKKYWKVSIQQ